MVLFNHNQFQPKVFQFIRQLYFVKPGVFINKDEDEESKKWTDRALMLEYGRIDLIEIEEEENGRFIQRIRARCFPFPLLNPSPQVWHGSAPPMVSVEKNGRAV